MSYAMYVANEENEVYKNLKKGNFKEITLEEIKEEMETIHLIKLINLLNKLKKLQ